VIFRADGIPVPQGSKFIARGRLLDVNKTKLEAWRAKVRAAALLAAEGAAPLDGPLGLSAHFYVPRPAKPRWHFPATKGTGDIDKLIRAVLDSLSTTPSARGVITDDARIVRIDAAKFYETDSAPGVAVAVFPVLDVYGMEGAEIG
jgi:Holliday junction resolvase RusA-like endonuclease